MSRNNGWPTIGGRDNGLPIKGYQNNGFPIFDFDEIHRRAGQAQIGAAEAKMALIRAERQRQEEEVGRILADSAGAFESWRARQEEMEQELNSIKLDRRLAKEQEPLTKLLASLDKFMASWQSEE